MKMTREQLDALMAWVDAKIVESTSANISYLNRLRECETDLKLAFLEQEGDDDHVQDRAEDQIHL